MRIIIALFVGVIVSSCSTVTPPLQLQQKVLGPRCSEWKLVAHAWSYHLLPYAIQEKALELMQIAKERNTRSGTDPAGYKGDAVSRTLGFILRNDVKDRARVNMVLRVYYLDPETTHVVRHLGFLRITDGVGSIPLPDDPREWIVETIWPDSVFSPIKSGGEPRLWLFGDEWKFYCTMNVHGLVP